MIDKSGTLEFYKTRIAELEAQVDALTKERDRWKADYLEQVEKHNLTLDELREIEAERDTWADNCDRVYAQLAAAQSRIKVLREHLQLAVEYGPAMAIGNVLSKDALTQPDDHTALDELLKQERERTLVGVIAAVDSCGFVSIEQLERMK